MPPKLVQVKVWMIGALNGRLGVEVVITEVVEDAAVDVVGAGLRDQADLPAGGPAV